jgi:hypothetical protein
LKIALVPLVKQLYEKKEKKTASPELSCTKQVFSSMTSITSVGTGDLYLGHQI